MKKIILFGSGSAASIIQELIEDPIAYCVDNNNEKWSQKLNGIQILSPESLLSEDKGEILIVIASSYQQEISIQLEEMGFIQNIHFINYMENSAAVNHGRVSYAQEGEDLLLHRLFGSKMTGYYVDVGAHHPIRFSNTYFFYKLGWHGINIDPMPGTKLRFDLLRPRDINLELGIAQKEGFMNYHLFNEPALNTFDEAIARQIISETSYKKIDNISVKLKPLSDVLNQYAQDKAIDFLSIDAEGLDLDVLLSNNWVQHRPKIILVEILQVNLTEIYDSPVHRLLIEENYFLLSKLFNTYVYQNKTIHF